MRRWLNIGMWVVIALWLTFVAWSDTQAQRGGFGTGTGTGTGADPGKVSKHPAGDCIMLETGDFLLQESSSYLFKE